MDLTSRRSHRLAGAIRDRELSAAEVVEAHLRRIDDVGPRRRGAGGRRDGGRAPAGGRRDPARQDELPPYSSSGRRRERFDLAAPPLASRPAAGATPRSGASWRCAAAAPPGRPPAAARAAPARARGCAPGSACPARSPSRAARAARRSRAFCASDSVSEAPTSNTASTREAVTFACWPPGPEERLVRSSTSASGTRRPSRTGRIGHQQGHNFATAPEVRVGATVQPGLGAD